jgi:hypothetical protein
MFNDGRADCQSIRDDQGFWNQLQKYLRDRSDEDFSRGICPAWATKLNPNLACEPG